MMEKIQAARWIFIVLIVGFCVGVVLGYFYFDRYIHNYTNKCVKAFDDCRERYNSLVVVQTSPGLEEIPFNVSFGIEEGKHDT